jgi:hypothetical protein
LGCLVINISSDHFADEVTITYEDEDSNVSYNFWGCYKTVFEHDLGYIKDRPSKELTRGQIPYFIHDVEIGHIEQNGSEFYTCRIVMPPMHVEIWCKEIKVEKQQKLETE